MPLVVRHAGDEGRWIDRSPEWRRRKLADDEVARLRSLFADLLRRSGFSARQAAQVLYPDRDPEVARVQVHRMLEELDGDLGGAGYTLADLARG